jgi:hypothetical protein
MSADILAEATSVEGAIANLLSVEMPDAKQGKVAPGLASTDEVSA